ncbi:hypothetical protein WQ57_11170 [Mesobacillus campisalis]|uniref:Uncharacterized protein n=1 Tax=Mesobacillus campisalis TaxID=1408103 RepID=A0A0M2SV45_9BACI|nr:hypothetical protein WQ57_11170 [Mesobacillus campisalis]
MFRFLIYCPFSVIYVPFLTFYIPFQQIYFPLKTFYFPYSLIYKPNTNFIQKKKPSSKGLLMVFSYFPQSFSAVFLQVLP